MREEVQTYDDHPSADAETAIAVDEFYDFMIEGAGRWKRLVKKHFIATK